MERSYRVEIRVTAEQVIMVLKDPHGDKEYFMTSEHALQLSMTLESAVEQMHDERFKTLPKIAYSSKSGNH